jgi:hypothetical protein
MPLKSKRHKKNTSLFCSKRKRKKSFWQMEFDTNKKRVLADSDLGSWFSQDQQWSEQFEDSATCSSAMTQTATVSASKRKIEESMKSLIKNSHSAGSETSDSDQQFLSSKDEEGPEGSSGFSKPTGNYIVTTGNLQYMLESSAVCKVCYSSLQIVEKLGSKQGLGAKLDFRCTNESCVSKESNESYPILPKSNKIYNVNRASVVAFRAIGKGRSAVHGGRLLSILLPLRFQYVIRT